MIEAIVRRYAGVLLPLALILSACQKTPLPVTDVFTPTPTAQITAPQPTTTPTLAPSSTPFPTSTPTATPTVALPVLAGTPVPLPVEPITPQNADRIQELAIWGKGYVQHVAFSPDGKLLAVGTTIGIWLYDTETFEVIRFINTDSWADQLTFAPDGRQLFARVGITAIATWEIATGKLVHWIDLEGTVKAYHIGDVPLVAVSGDEPQVELRNMQNETLVKAQSGFADDVFVAAFAPDGSLMAVGLRNQTILVWDIQADAVLSIPTGHGSLIECLAFAPNGGLLASGAIDKTVRLWDTRTGEPVHILEGHLATVSSLAFSPDGKALASGSWDHTIKLWDVETGSLVRTLTDSTSFVETLAFTPNGKVLASSGQFEGTVQWWNVERGMLSRELDGYDYEVTGLAVSPHNDVFVSYFSNNQIYQWNIETGQIVRTFSGHKTGVEHLALSADGMTLASSEANTGYPGAWIWNTVTGHRLRIFDQNGLFGLALSPNGSLVAVGGYRRWTVVYEVETGQERYVLNDDGAGARMAFSSNGTRLATAGSSASSVYDVETGELLLQMPAPDDYALSALSAWSSDDRLLATGSYAGVVWLRNAETGEILHTWPDLNGEIVSLAFSPDDTILVVALESHVNALEESGATVVLLDVNTGERLSAGTLAGYRSGVRRALFSSDGTWLVTGASDGTVRLWGIPPSK